MVDRIVRRAAAQRITNYAETTTDESESDKPMRRKKGTATIKYSGKRTAKPLKIKTSSTRPLHASFTEPSTSISVSISTPSTRPRPRPKFSKKKEGDPEPEPNVLKPISTSTISNGSVSDLTPLSSPINSFNQETRSPPSVSRAPQALGSQKRRSPPSPSTSAQTRRFIKDETWTHTTLGAYVWILIDSRARVFDPRDITGRSIERLWWPGKIEHSSTASPMKVRLFGNASPGVKNVEIEYPSEVNIQSLNDPLHRSRFDSPTFVTLSDSDSDDLHESPRKKQKRDRGDLEERWSLAVADMVRKKTEEEDGSDDLPEVGTLEFKYTPASPTKSVKETPNRTQKNKTSRTSELASDEATNAYLELGTIHVDRWSPPLADDALTIPGELVLAREKRAKTEYWPARILKYIPPTKRSQVPKYVVEFLDGGERAIPRDIFYTTDEDGFATCTVGEWKSEFQDILNDDEEETSNSQDIRERSPSPSPCNPPPPSAVFTHLSIREQFVYTKPVLQGILNEGYVPARMRHRKFLLGGQARQSVVDEAGLRGQMNPKHVAELQEYLIAWCLRDERRGDFIADDGDEVKGEGSAVNETPSEREVPDVPDHSDITQESLTRSLSPSRTIPNVSPTSSRGDVPPPPPSSCNAIEEIEAPPLSLPSTSSSFLDSPQETPTQSDVDMDLTLDDGNDDDAVSHSTSAREAEAETHCESSRQYGCDAFEALSKREKNDYCLNVLLPEAILQILLWRAGLRASVELLSEVKEQELHDQGDVLINERDWVYDVIRLRTSKIRQLKRTQSVGKGSVPLGPLSVTGRPRRNVNAPGSYRE